MKNLTVEDLEARARHRQDDLVFPPVNDRMCEGSRSVWSWVIGYLNYRMSVNSDIGKSQAYLNGIGQNSSNYASKFRGAMIGLALGDAMGSTLEFSRRDTLPLVTDLIGGGPFGLKPGEWTDDTSMALCVAHSLTRCEYFSPQDQMDLFLLWWKKGIFSVNGYCFDIGNTVVNALTNYLSTGDGYSGSKDPRTAGNGSLMRLAPMALFYFSDPNQCVERCSSSSKTTHAAIEAVDSCRYFGALLHGALRGHSKERLTSGLYEPARNFWERNPLVSTVVEAAENAKFKSRQEIKSSGYVIDSLEAALWAFSNTESFEEGLVLAINLAGDSDTIGAIYGQLAGAYYGEYEIPAAWIKKLAKFHVFYMYADKLLRFGMCDMPVHFED